MSDVALRMEHVYKKFRKGEIFDSLRDLIPALTGRMFRQRELGDGDQREFWALQDISFEVKRGEAFGIIGHNGAGKSTALKILNRIMKPTKGSMIVNGRLSALIEVGAGFHPDLTGRENIFLYGTILGMNKPEIQSKLDQIVAFSGLEEFIDTPVKRYSSGMHARLGFSVAAHVDPEVLIVDEVLSVGDFVFQQNCMERMRSVIQGGATVLFVSHNLKAVTELCQRTMLLEHGKVVTTGPTDAVIRRYMSDILKPDSKLENKKAYISNVTVRDSAGEQATFESGQTAWVDVEVTAREAVDKLAVVIWLNDETQYEIFNTSTERLGYGSFSLKPGQTYKCTFELTLNAAHGSFGLCVCIHRYDIQQDFDRRVPAAMLFVGSSMGVRGAVNCFPKVLRAGVVETAKEVVRT
ncbi:MAG TPA: ABC transporter ATP-binding protein [Terriglobales bacterium]|jgi:ABC-type polysaccharide/polyol phosphate transport system ATPase subunit|nr:ABC transporter ATP-binding protein [Terriglobales bacterium]